MTIDVGTAKNFYGPDAPSLQDLQDVRPSMPAWETDLLLQNGQRVISSEVAHNAIRNSDYGEILYCKALAGNYGTFQWQDKGGSVKILYSLPDDCLHIGLMLQARPTQVRHTKVYEVPRGFREEGEDPVMTARRELIEEVGLRVDYDSIIPIGVGNPNNTFVLGCPLKFFAVEISSLWLEPIAGTRHLLFTADVLKDDIDAKYQRQKEGIEATRFLPYDEVARLVEQNSWLMGSMPMLSAIALLGFHLSRRGIRWQLART